MLKLKKKENINHFVCWHKQRERERERDSESERERKKIQNINSKLYYPTKREREREREKHFRTRSNGFPGPISETSLVLCECLPTNKFPLVFNGLAFWNQPRQLISLVQKWFLLCFQFSQSAMQAASPPASVLWKLV